MFCLASARLHLGEAVQMEGDILQLYLSLSDKDKEKVNQLIDYLLNQQLNDQQSSDSQV